MFYYIYLIFLYIVTANNLRTNKLLANNVSEVIINENNYTKVNNVSEVVINNSNSNVEYNKIIFTVCPKYDNNSLILPLFIELQTENKYKQDKYFKYYITGDYLCRFGEILGEQPTSTLLNVPLIVENITQKYQSIVINRQFGSDITESILNIYNPYNILNILPTFYTIIWDNALHLYPWKPSLENIYVSVEYTKLFTSIHIPNFNIQMIIIEFDNFNNIVDNAQIQTYLKIVKTLYK